MFVQVAPVADDMTVQEFCGPLFTALQRIQGTWSRDDCPETESRCSDDNLLCQRETLTELVIARIVENRHRNRGVGRMANRNSPVKKAYL